MLPEGSWVVFIASGVEDLADDTEVVDTRCNPADHLNSRAVMVTDGFAGTPLWMIGLFFTFFFGAGMVVLEKGSTYTWHLLTRGFYVHAERMRCTTMSDVMMNLC